MNQEDANNCFKGRNGERLMVDFKNSDALTFKSVSAEKDGKYAVFVNFANKSAMTMGICCHEASHVCDAIEEDIGMEHGGEPSAYLIGWISSCINKARLGIGDFVEIKDREK
jgi:hypothetical protein